jgi:hypothetical protein
VALHVTAELKFPVPVTVAEHWLVWPEVTVDGEQATLTPVMVDVDPLLPLPPPQAAINITFPATNNNASLRTDDLSSANVVGCNALRYELWYVGLAVKVSRVAGLAEHQVRSLNDYRPSASVRLLFTALLAGGLLRTCLISLLVIGAK